MRPTNDLKMNSDGSRYEGRCQKSQYWFDDFRVNTGAPPLLIPLESHKNKKRKLSIKSTVRHIYPGRSVLLLFVGFSLRPRGLSRSTHADCDSRETQGICYVGRSRRAALKQECHTHTQRLCWGLFTLFVVAFSRGRSSVAFAFTLSFTFAV